MIENLKINRSFLCFDLKSFYASVECIERGLDPFKTSLVVADTSRGNGSVCLALTPRFKEMYKIGGRPRIYELPKNEDIMIVQPRMSLYVKYSVEIFSIYNSFVSREDMHIYSIDECFLDVTEYLKYYKCTPIELAKIIMKKILDVTGIIATCGIGKNMLMSKLALDLDSKFAKDYIAVWDYKDIKTNLWPITPLSRMWGIGPQMQKKLNQLGMYKVGDIANSSFYDLQKHFGLLGEELWMHSHGIDQTDITKKVVTKKKSIGKSQMFFKDFYKHDMKFIIVEMIDDVLQMLRNIKSAARVFTLAIMYSHKVGAGGFSRQKKVPLTNNFNNIKKIMFDIFDEFIENKPIRKLSIRFGDIASEVFIRDDLFNTNFEDEKTKKLQLAIDGIQSKYGKSMILRGKSFTDKGTSRIRSKLIGGHNAE